MSKKESLYFLINKPYGVLSQFTSEDGNPGLGTIYDLPKDVYPLGRLDKDSEGLLILSNNRSLNDKLLNPKNMHSRTYLVEVDGVPSPESLSKLEKGLIISVNGKKHKTRPCKARLVQINLEERDPPVNRKKHPKTSWLELCLNEGKNRQVRRMTAAVSHPTLRLIRVAIEDVQLGDMKPGQLVQISDKAIKKKLKI